MLKLGDTLHRPSGASNHLFAVIVGPVTIENRGNAKQYVLVNFSSIKAHDGHDTSCEIKAGEHPSITRDSYAVYRKAEIVREDDVLNAVAQGVYKLATPCSPVLLSKAITGALASKLISREIKSLLLKNAKAHT
jgi:hypothetical protein